MTALNKLKPAICPTQLLLPHGSGDQEGVGKLWGFPAFLLPFSHFRYSIKGWDLWREQQSLLRLSPDLENLFPPLAGLTVLFDWSYFTHYLPVHIPIHSQPIWLYKAGAAGSWDHSSLRKALEWSSWWVLGSEIWPGAWLLHTCWRRKQCSPETDSYPRSFPCGRIHTDSHYPCSETFYLPWDPPFLLQPWDLLFLCKQSDSSNLENSGGRKPALLLLWAVVFV